MAKKNYDDNRASLAQLLKQEPVPTPIQEVRPVEIKPAEEELVRISGFWVPKELGRRLKVHAATTDLQQREILIEALDIYLPK